MDGTGIKKKKPAWSFHLSGTGGVEPHRFLFHDKCTQMATF